MALLTMARQVPQLLAITLAIHHPQVQQLLEHHAFDLTSLSSSSSSSLAPSDLSETTSPSLSPPPSSAYLDGQATLSLLKREIA